MIHTVSRRTRAAIERLTREVQVDGQPIRYCPCRVLPETVLNLKTVMRDVERLWREDLGRDAWERLVATDAGARFFAGEVRMVEVQQGRPNMVAVWLPIPPDYPGRLKVQLIDAVEPYEEP